MSRFGAFPRTPALRGGCSGASCLGGGRNPPPSFGLLLVPSESALAQPPSSSVSLRLMASFFYQYLRFTAALTRGRGRPSENVRGANPHALGPPFRPRAKVPPWQSHITARLPTLKPSCTQLPFLFFQFALSCLVSPIRRDTLSPLRRTREATFRLRRW